MMHLSVEWETNLFIVFLAKLAKPLNGNAQIIINHIYMKGDFQVMPILEGKAIGSGQLLQATELPGFSSWLGKILSDTLAKTLVEPRRGWFPLVVASRARKKAVAGVIHVTMDGAHHISSGCRQEDDLLHTFVEVQLDQLSRRTDVKKGPNPTWNSTFNMLFHNHSGILKFRLYRCNPTSVRYDYLASCEIKVRYCDDDSTIFWAVGPNFSAIASQAATCGQQVELMVPFEGTNSGEIMVRLVLQEWQFSDDLKSFPLSSQQTGGSTNISATTGRKFYVNRNRL